MALSFDGPNKVITISGGTVALNTNDLWSRWVDWTLTGDNSKYLPAMSQLGGNDIDAAAGTKVPVYIFLLNGWRIRPQEAHHTLNVSGGILLVAGGGDPFINTAGAFNVRINYQQPVQAITVSTGGGGGGLSPADAAKLDDLHKVHGLDPAAPLTVTPASRVAGAVEQVITGDGDTTSTVTRQP